MIIKSRGTLCKMQVSKRPASSVPKKESSIHLDLQVLYSKKNMLESTVKIWESKLNSIHYELSKVNHEIDKMESYISKKRNEVQAGTGCCKPDNIIGNTADNKIKIVEVEY